MKRLLRVSTRLGIKPEMKVWDQFLIRRTGQRMITFVTDIKKLEDGHKVLLTLQDCHVGRCRPLNRPLPLPLPLPLHLHLHIYPLNFL